MKWVTFYYDAMRGRGYAFVEHKDKASATEYFERHYRSYFQLRKEIKVKLPMAYGFSFRQYVGIFVLSRNILER